MTFTPTDLRPGDLMFGPIGGLVPGVIPVGAGQVALAPWKTRLSWRKWWRMRHAATVTHAAAEPAARTMMDPSGVLIAQAMPSGFEEVPLGSHRWTPDYVFIRPPYGPGQAAEVAEHAIRMAMRKVPYGFEDYAAIGAHRAHLPVPHLDAFISRVDADGYPRRSICSQAVDAQLTLAGFRVFADDRLSQDVVPSELYLRLVTWPGATIIRPGSPTIRLTIPARLTGGEPRADPGALRAEAVARDLL